MTFCRDLRLTFSLPTQGAHNAAADARMTMELYNLWRRAGDSGQPLGVPLSFFVVNFHCFTPNKSRHPTLWKLLRPEGAPGWRGRQTALERDSGNNTYK